MKYLTVIQARSSSSRLPGKSLMLVGGMPLVQLCAVRAKNPFSQVLVATSNDDSDDELKEPPSSQESVLPRSLPNWVFKLGEK